MNMLANNSYTLTLDGIPTMINTRTEATATTSEANFTTLMAKTMAKKTKIIAALGQTNIPCRNPYIQCCQ